MGSRTRFGRFKPLDSIDWLHEDDKQRYRNNIRVFTDIMLALERSLPLSAEQEAFVSQLTEAQSRDGRMDCMARALEQAEMVYFKKLADMAPHDLGSFHELMNPHEPPAYHHRWLCDRLMKVESGDLNCLVISLPPGAAKSTYGSRSFTAWYMGRNPDKKFIGIGHSQEFSEDMFSKPIRDMIDSDVFRMAFPDVQLNPNERASRFWRLDQWRGSYACRGAQSGMSGLRADIVDIDDPYKDSKAALSPAVRETVWRTFTADVLPRCLEGAPIILITTRWQSDDIAGRIEMLNREKPEALPQPCEIINIPAQAEADDPLGRKPGEWLWCKDEQADGFYSINHYETRRNTMSPGMWSSLYLGKPLDKMGEFVCEDNFQRYQHFPVNREGETKQWIKTVISVDTATKATERSDNTVIEVFRQGVDGYHYLIDVWRGQKVLDEVMRILATLIRRWEAGYCIIEDSGMGAQMLQNYQGRSPCPLVSYNPSGKGSKEFRFDAAAKWITTGRVLFPEQAPWLADFVNELVAFPYGTYDDQVDAFSQYTDHELKVRVGGSKPLKFRGF